MTELPEKDGQRKGKEALNTGENVRGHEETEDTKAEAGTEQQKYAEAKAGHRQECAETEAEHPQERAELETKDAQENRQECVKQDAENAQAHRGRFAAGFLLGILTAVVCSGVFILGWYWAQRSDSGRSDEAAQEGASVLTDAETLYKLGEVQTLIGQHYLKDVDGEQLVTYLFKGIAAGLDDPYANYYSVEELQSVLDSSRGEYYGIGATLASDAASGELVVYEVYDGGPADEAGLLEGDVLLALDGTELAGVGLSDAVTMIKGHDGPFTLTVYRAETDEELELTMECGDVQPDYVTYEMLDGKIGYLALSEFTERAVDQFREAIDALQEQGMKKLIVDLRDNPGGLLDSVCDILDEVLPEGLIVYTEDRNGERQEYYADGKRSVTCEIAVLVNGNSASASEIFAGAIQDWELGPVIGTKTYGKGVVQQTYTLPDGSAFKMTTETYYTPKGQEIDGNGITPDIIIEETQTESDASQEESEAQTESGASQERDAVLEKAVEALTAADE